MENSFIEILLSQKYLPTPIELMSEAKIEEISKTICGLLNTQGGWIIVGVDKSFNSIGVENSDIIRDIQYDITNNIVPLPLVYVQEDNYKGKLVILITVIKGTLSPYSYNNKYYVKRGDEIVNPMPDEISRLHRDSYKSSWETTSNLYVDHNYLNKELMDVVYNNGISTNRLITSPNGLYSILSELQLLNSYEVKNGAVALFADNIRNYLPQCKIRIQLMSKGKEASVYDDTLIIENNIFYALDEVIKYFKERLPKQSIFLENNITRIDDYVYPLEVLDEAISNALIHRDYSDPFDEITIFIYPDKIEITNPGILPEKIIRSRNEVLPHGSILRNPIMAEIYYIAGRMEKTGRGLTLISNRMRDLGKKLPEWRCVNNHTTLTIYSRIGKLILNERIKKFLESCKIGDTFSKTEYIEYFEKQPSKITAQNDISSMLNFGICSKLGNGPSTKYVIEKLNSLV